MLRRGHASGTASGTEAKKRNTDSQADSQADGRAQPRGHFKCKKCGTSNVIKQRMNVSERVQGVMKQYNISVPEPPDFFQNRTGFPFDFDFGGNETRRGIVARQRGLSPKHPVVIVPGFVTTGLELWAGLPCASPSFRLRLWGTMKMPQSILSNAKCWVEHMELNQSTGLDPQGVMLRASEGLAAVDFLMPSYYVWAKIIEAFADLGYDPNMMIASPYDWRLSIANMERRDNYFSRLQDQIELLHKLKKEKVMLTTHSWGEIVVRNFLAWVDNKEPGWTDRHIAIYFNIAGSTLGVPKALTALLSGEMRDTAELGFLSKYATDMYLPRPSRAHMFRSWGSLIGMLPQGGNKVWGNATWAPDDNDAMRDAGATYGSFISALDVDGSKDNDLHEWFNQLISRKPPLKGGQDKGKEAEDLGDGGTTSQWKAMSVDEAMGLLLEEGAFNSSPDLHEHIGKWGASIGPGGKRQHMYTGELVENDEHSVITSDTGDGVDAEAGVTFQDPLNDPLPNAPDMKMFCVYGVNKPVERSYRYLHLKDEEQVRQTNKEDEAAREVGVPLQWSIATESSNSSTFMDSGVRKGDGDGTVPLVSLGLMCRKGWKSKKLNPAGISIVTHELKHDPVPMYLDPRGGGKSGDHVDVLANHGLLDILLSVASGSYSEVRDNIVSDIDNIAARVDFD